MNFQQLSVSEPQWNTKCSKQGKVARKRYQVKYKNIFRTMQSADLSLIKSTGIFSRERAIKLPVAT